MSKLMKRSLTQAKPELPEVKPVETVVPIRMLRPNILIGQNQIVIEPTLHNAMGIYAGDTADSLECKGGYGYYYHLMSEASKQKLDFLLSDAYMSTLNACINVGLIDYDKVNLSEFGRLGFGINYSNIEKNIGAEASLLCCELYNVLYKYAIFGRRTKDAEEAKEVVIALNNIVANVSNIILYHLSGYYNEMMALRAMSSHDISMLDKIGKYDNAYKTENVLGSVFVDKDQLEHNDTVIEADLAADDALAGVEFKFNPAVMKKQYEDPEF